jgi:hypothetical protein
MQMTLDEYSSRFPDRPPPVPFDYAGQWIAWNEGRTEILAYGSDFTEVHDQAVQRGCAHPVLHKIPRGALIGRA